MPAATADAKVAKGTAESGPTNCFPFSSSLFSYFISSILTYSCSLVDYSIASLLSDALDQRLNAQFDDFLHRG